MTTVVLSAGSQKQTMWRIGLIVAGGIFGTAGFGHAQQAKSAKPAAKKDTAIRTLQPADVAELPPAFVEKLNESFGRAVRQVLQVFDHEQIAAAGFRKSLGSDSGLVFVPGKREIVGGQYERGQCRRHAADILDKCSHQA